MDLTAEAKMLYQAQPTAYNARALQVAVRLDALDWQPIETAPKDGTDVLLYKRYPKYQEWVGKDEYDFYIQIGCYNAGDWSIHAFDPPWDNDPTHWMPLPQPPKA